VAVRYRFAGAPKKLTLGPYPSIELKKARRLAGKAFETLADGKDPSTEKRKSKVEARRAELEKKRGQRDLFENVAIEFIERYAKPRAIKKNRPDAWKEPARILGLKESSDDPKKLIESGGGYFVPHWSGRKVQEITKRDVVERLEQIADDAPIMANRAFAALRKMMNWAVGRDVLGASPCTGVQMPCPSAPATAC
jgi:Arm DNA-binding domain